MSAAVAEAVSERPDARWSLSGTADFVSSVAAQLASAGVSSRRIHKDAFWGMRAASAPALRLELAAA